MKQFELKIAEHQNTWDMVSQKVWSDNPDEKVSFFVTDLYECPEDAVIGRDLFDASDFIRAIQLGFRIAKRGYDEIVVNEVPWPE